MDKQDYDSVKKSSTSQATISFPTFNELLKSTAIHGSLMGNLSGFRKGTLLYKTEDGTMAYMVTQLVTYSRDVIRIYNVEARVTASKVPNKKTSEFHLSLTHEVPLFGEIKKISMIHNKDDDNKGYLIVLFEDHKMSTLTLDALTNTLSVVDLHNFENPGTDLLKKGQTSFHEDPIIKVDKFNRCIGILMYRYLLTMVFTEAFYKSLEVNLANDILVLPNYASLSKDPNAEPPFYGMTYYFNLYDYNLNNPVDFEVVEFEKELRICILNRHASLHKGALGGKMNTCELVNFKLNKKFFTTPTWEKNQMKPSTKENIEINDHCMKFKFLPSDCFKVISLPRGGYLVMSKFMILFFDVVRGKDECLGFLVNQQYGATEEYLKQYYKCNLVNSKLDNQIDLTNYKFQVLDPSHILLTGIGAYLLRLDLKKEGLVENMEIFRIPELIDQRISFVAMQSKIQKENQYLLFLGSYMTHAQLIDLEIYTEPRPDLQMNKRARLLEERPDMHPSQMDDIYHTLEIKDTIQTMSPISDLIAPKWSSSNPFHLVASCSYGVHSSLLFMQTRVELKPTTDMCEVDPNTKSIISVKNPEDNTNYIKYLLLSKEAETEVLVYDNGQLMRPKPENNLFLLNEPTFRCKRLKVAGHPILIQITSQIIRFINSQTRSFYDVPVAHAVDCRLKGQTIVVLTAQRQLEVYTFYIPEDGEVQNVYFQQKQFQESNVVRFALLKRKRTFPSGWDKDDIVLAVATESYSLKMFLIPTPYEKPVQLFFECPYLNEGVSNLFNVIDEEKAASTLLTRIISNSSIANPRGFTMKSLCTYGIEEIYLRELHQSILLIVRISNGEYYFYKSYSNEFNSRYILGYSIGFQRLSTPVFKSFKDKAPNPPENAMVLDDTNPFKARKATIFKHKYNRQKSCLCICSEDVYIWLFFNKDEIFFHSTRKDDLNTFQGLCDFNIPDWEGYFTSVVNEKLYAFSLNNLGLDYENALPLKRFNAYKTVRNLLAFPQAEPRYVVFISSQRTPMEEIFQINLVDTKTQTLLNNVDAEKNAKILKIKTLDLDINGAKIPVIAAVFFKMKIPGTYSHAAKVGLYNVEKGGQLNLMHEVPFENEPVTDVFTINGLLFVCAGNMILWLKIGMNEEKKFFHEKISYIFTEKFLVVETLVLPNFLICSDIRRSISVFYWQVENPIKLAPKGDSFSSHIHYGIEFFDSLSDNLRVIAADGQKNVSLLSFSSSSEYSSFPLVILLGQKIEKIADFHVGALVTKFRRHRPSLKSHDTLLFSTSEGGLCFIGTYDPNVFSNLSRLQNLLVIEFPFIAGLHPKAYRLFYSDDHNQRAKPKKNFLDGKLLNYYCHLSYSMQTKIAKVLKDTRENLLNLIHNLFSVNSIF